MSRDFEAVKTQGIMVGQCMFRLLETTRLKFRHEHLHGTFVLLLWARMCQVQCLLDRVAESMLYLSYLSIARSPSYAACYFRHGSSFHSIDTTQRRY